MGLLERLAALQDRAEEQIDILNSKKKTEQALLLPFVDAMGYDPFDVHEVEPDRTVEVGQEDTARIDYTVKIGGTPALLFQCTPSGEELGGVQSPLPRHLGTLDASLVALTNGLRYRFYADFGEGTVDRQPFFEFDLLEFEPDQTTYLKRLVKPAFDAEEALSVAFQLKYSRLLENYLARQRESPDKHFVRFLAAQVHEGELSEATLGRFHAVVQTLLRRFDVETRKVAPDGGGQAENTGSPGPEGLLDTDGSFDTAHRSGGKEAQPEDREEAAPSDGSSSEEPSSADEVPLVSEGTPESEGAETGEAQSEEAEIGDADSDGERKERNGERTDEEPDGGSSLAEEFANKVVGKD